MTRVPWSANELLVAFRLYCRTPFGRLHRLNPEIINLARMLGRTPSAIAMKACNFASLDPAQKNRQIKALGNTSEADRMLWKRFGQNPEEIAHEAEAAYAKISERIPLPTVAEPQIPEGPTETLQTVRARRVQSFFRDAVLVSYENRCALSALALPELLNASHIIPWSVDVQRRADPRNGIALNVLYDRAFDRGLITFDASLCVVLSQRLKKTREPLFHRDVLLALEGRRLTLPKRFVPDPDALTYHREHVFSR